MRRHACAFVFGSLLTFSREAPGGSPSAAALAKAPPDVRWTLHVIYLPGTRDARPPVNAEGGTVAVSAPWQCVYKKLAGEQQEMVKIKCMHESGAVVGTLAMCRREVGQSDLAQLSIGIDGVSAYETLDLSCSVPPSHPDEADDGHK
ncbi:MAG: hypothetical protein M3O50_15190 [Myxococcota bacterium]|nr:hypothetical protein [Myxococcota bacterium]